MAKLSLFDRRRRRVRTALKSRASGRPRLSVHRTGKHIYAQIIDDGEGKTLAAANSLGAKGANVDTAANGKILPGLVCCNDVAIGIDYGDMR